MDPSAANNAPVLDIDRVRSSFPGLSNGWTLMDNAGGSQALASVVERIGEHLLNRNVQIGGTYETSLKAAESLHEGRRAVMQMVNAERPEEIVFAPTSTVALQNLSRSIAHLLSAGDEIVVTNFDHESNIGPWLSLEEKGVKIRVWELNRESLKPDPAELDLLLGSRTRLVAVTHVSNILGWINPIRAITEKAHAAGAMVCVDSVAFAPHRAIDVAELDVDFLVFSAYKAYGPHISAMYGKYDLLLELDNLYHYFYGRDKVPAKLEPGNANYELAYSLTAVRDYLLALGEEAGDARQRIVSAFDAIAAHEALIGERLLSYLRSKKEIRIIGDVRGSDPSRVPTVSFVVDGRDPGELARGLEEYRIAARFGDFHARRLIEYLGLSGNNGVVRISLVHYNTPEEVDGLIRALDELI